MALSRFDKLTTLSRPKGLSKGSSHRGRRTEEEPPLEALLLWRREQDSNPRTFRLTVFKTAALDHSAIPPALPL